MSKLQEIERWIDSRRRHPLCSTDVGRALDSLSLCVSVIEDECLPDQIDITFAEIHEILCIDNGETEGKPE